LHDRRGNDFSVGEQKLNDFAVAEAKIGEKKTIKKIKLKV